MDIEKEREAFENFFYENCLVQWEKDMHEMLFQKLESGDYEYVRLQSSWLSWQAAKAQAVPEGFVLVSSKSLCELAIAINNVDLATHTENKTNEVREMWQDIAIKLSSLGEAQEQN